MGQRRQRRGQRAYLASIGITGSDAQDDRVIYFHDVPDAVVEEAYAHGEPQQSMTPDGPTVCARGLARRPDPGARRPRRSPLPGGFQRRVARERLGIEADVIDGGHMVCLSHPRELVERLERYRQELADT